MNYTVKRGDTLWDIAAVFLKDPWFWPEIWQINPQVENPHLIYPGDVLSLAYGANGDAHVSVSQYSGARLQPRPAQRRTRRPDRHAAVRGHRGIPFQAERDDAGTDPACPAHPRVPRSAHDRRHGSRSLRAAPERAAQPALTRSCTSATRSTTSTTNELVGYQAAYVATAVVNAPGQRHHQDHAHRRLRAKRCAAIGWSCRKARRR